MISDPEIEKRETSGWGGDCMTGLLVAVKILRGFPSSNPCPSPTRIPGDAGQPPRRCTTKERKVHATNISVQKLQITVCPVVIDHPPYFGMIYGRVNWSAQSK